jgi:hypothetical protein
VLVADEIVHDGRGSGESRGHAGFYQRARFWALFTVTFRLTFSAST